MGVLTGATAYETLKVRFEQDICFLRIHRPEADNTINNLLIAEIGSVLSICEGSAKIVVLEGLPEVFCFGADFKSIQAGLETGDRSQEQDPEALYDLWMRLASGPYISIAHVRGKVNAGGVGFVAACDVVLSEEKAVFSLSELLFGLMPACVMPFLNRRMGYAKGNYLTLMTSPITAAQAQLWGLVDACEKDSESLLRKHLLRLRRLDKAGISRYKRYLSSLDESLVVSKPKALRANREVFSNTRNLEKISHFVKTGQFPWEGS